MSKAMQLPPPVRDFFRLVYRAGLASPFSDERVRIEEQIAGRADGSGRQRIEGALHTVRKHLSQLEQAQRIDYTRYEPSDGLLVKAGVLFDFFYTFRKRFDQLIHDQIQAGEMPLKVVFAPEALAFLRQRGFNDADSLRYFALSYGAQ